MHEDLTELWVYICKWIGSTVSLLLVCAWSTGLFNVRLNVAVRFEWYSKSVSVYIIHPSTGLWYLTPVLCNWCHFTAECIMDSSTHFQAPLQAAYFLWSCDKVYHKQDVCFLLYFLGQIVSWQYNPNPLD